MNFTRTHLAAVAAALSAIAIAAPVSTAGAATAGAAVTRPSAGQRAPVTGPTFITNAPSSFVNTNIQVSASDNASGAQVAP